MNRVLILVTLLMMGPAAAQPAAPPVENITVTGARTRQAIEGFVQSLATPTRAAGKIARWQDPICPTVLGLKKQFAQFIAQRLRDIAAKAGVPINGKSDCLPNIAIVFTTAPQKLMDNIRKNQPELLGYYDNSAQADALAKVTRPIQAWYQTETKDLNGKAEPDSGQTRGPGLEIYLPCPDQPGGVCLMHLPNAHASAVSGTRLGDGLKSGLYNVLIAADPGKLVDNEIGALSDYIAMLALAQVKTPDICQPLDSILNLLADGCPAPASLTANDIGYLTALYKMSPESTIQVQRNEMAYQMEQAQDGH